MRYPTCYVLVTDMDDYLMAGRGTNVVNVGQAAPSSLKGGLTNETSQEASETTTLPAHNSPFMASTHTLLASEYLSCGGRGLGWSRGMCERVWQDVVQCPGQLPPTPHDGLTPEGALIPAEIAGQWEFSDPATKISCSCAKYELCCCGTLQALALPWPGSTVAAVDSSLCHLLSKNLPLFCLNSFDLTLL